MTELAFLIESYFFHCGYSNELRERVLARTLYLVLSRSGLDHEAYLVAETYPVDYGFIAGMDRVQDEFALQIFQANKVPLHEGIMALKSCLYNLPAYSENGQCA